MTGPVTGPVTGARSFTRLVAPGTGQVVTFERDRASGRLLGIEAGARRYLRTGADGSAWWDTDLARVTEARTRTGMVRRVQASGRSWSERYDWDGEGHLVHVDGVDVRRDDHGRVAACVPGGDDPAPAAHRWSYGYSGWALTTVDGPAGARHLAVDADARVHSWRSSDGRAAGLAYDQRGRRTDTEPLPDRTHHRDAAGRLWAVTGLDGRVRSSWLWDGFRCLGRVDGPFGQPLAALFSLDPSGTPVRVCARGRTDPSRLPRDAFGEGLLSHPGVPGLYGGVVDGGLVHLPLRALDPRTASFCSPDPCDAGPLDPRWSDPGCRGPRWSGPGRAGPGRLPTEDHPSGRYAVCRHDPVGRADPTGGISAGLVISDLTWSLQNNLLAFFGIDWWFNLFGSLFTGFQLGDFGSSEGLKSSDRLGSFGLRRDGLIGHITGGRAFTTAHIVWAPAREFDELARGRVIDPAGRFEPSLYGTLLVARPEGQVPLVLRGSRNRGGVDPGDDAGLWSQAGGPAEPAAPGAVVPTFPSGGLHLAAGPLAFGGPRACPVGEVAPVGGVATGTLEPRTIVDLPDPNTAPPVGARVLLADVDGDLVITTVVSSTRDRDRGLLRLEDDSPAIGTTGFTLSVLDTAPASSENRPAEPAVTNAFSSRGATAVYAPGDLLRLDDTTSANVTVARILLLEARLPLDRPIPATLAPPLTVSATSVSPTPLRPLRRTADTVEFSPPGTAPAVGAAALARGNGQSVPVLVVAAVGAPGVATGMVQVDADLTALAAVDGALDWLVVTTGGALGRRAGAPEPEARVTYAPERAGAAPDGSASPVVVRVDAGPQAAVRLVTGVPAHDAVVADRAIGGAGPWVVERFRPLSGTADVTGLTVAQANAIVLRPAELVEGADALMLQRLTGDPPAPAGGPVLTGLTVTAGPPPPAGTPGSTATATVTLNPTTLGGRPTPGEIVLVGPAGGGPTQPALVTRVRVTPTFDRAIAVGAGSLGAVPLARSGPAWTATRLADRQVVLNPAARTGATSSVPVEFPRVAPGETVDARWTDGGSQTGRYRVAAVAGLTLDLEGEPAIGAAATDLRVTRLVPTDPATGGPLLARDGAGVGPSPTRQITFSTWEPGAFNPAAVVGITSGDRTDAAVVDPANQTVELTLATAAPLAVPGPVDIRLPTVERTGFAARFVREGDALLITDPLPNLATGAGQTLAVVGFRATDGQARSATLESGSLPVPQDETTEIDRRQSLIDHELTHTLQYARFGPLWFNCFPMLVLELPLELATTTELPSYSAFLPATVTASTSSSRFELRIPDRAGVTFSSGDHVQVCQGGRLVTVEVVSVDADVLTVKTRDNATPPTGAVQVRRRNDSPAWDVVFNIFQTLTHGGLLNVAVGSTWGGILWLLAKAGYGIFRAVKGTGDLHPVTVEAAGRELVLTTDEGRQAITGGMRLIVRQGDQTVVRTAARAGDVLTLDQPVAFRTDVRVAPYDFHDPGSAFDWLDYHPATIPDPANPAVLQLTPVGGSALTLAARDRVEVSYLGTNRRTNVTSVTGDQVELEDPLPLRLGETTARVAKVGERDPMGNADSAALVEMGMGWMQWLFDPYGQIQLDLRPENRWWDLTARVVRYLLGTQMWSLAPPVFGYVWWSRLFLGAANEHRAPIEQEASEESGDLYSPLGRLTGQQADDGFARRTMVVGDIARYRHWPLDRNASFVTTGELAAPGVHVAQGDLRVVTHRVATATDADPNGTTESDGAAAGGPGRTLPDLFAGKATPDPTVLGVAGPTAAGPSGFRPSERGQVPTPATTQRSVGTYVAFCRPGDHRVTTANGIFGAAQARDLHHPDRRGQTLFFDVTVADVDVRVGGQPVAEGSTVDLVLRQEAAVNVIPGGARQYRVTVVRPAGGIVGLGPTGTLVAGATTGTEPVEVSRFYAAGPGGSYADGGLARFGLHLGGDVHVPVRQFQVRVVDTVALRAAASPTAAPATTLAQGAIGFVLVPGSVVDPLRVITIGGAPPGPAQPSATVTRVAAPPAGAAAFVGPSGAVFQVTFAATPAIAAPVPVVMRVTVGNPSGPTADLSCTFDLTP